MILGATDQKLWVFEVFRRRWGRVGMCYSQPTRIDHLRKKWRVGEKKNSKKRAGTDCPGVDLRPTGNHWSSASPGAMTCSQQPLVARQLATSGQGLVVIGRLNPNRWLPGRHLDNLPLPFF
jgi:hypothetical protein